MIPHKYSNTTGYWLSLWDATYAENAPQVYTNAWRVLAAMEPQTRTPTCIYACRASIGAMGFPCHLYKGLRSRLRLSPLRYQSWPTSGTALLWTCRTGSTSVGYLEKMSGYQCLH